MYKIVPVERQGCSKGMIIKNRCKPSKNGLQRSFLAPPARLELTTFRLGGGPSILVRYGGIYRKLEKLFGFIRLQVSNDSIFRRRPLYPTELRGLIQKIFNFTRLRDSNGSIVRRRTLYPGEVRGHIQKIFNFAELWGSNGSIVRRRSLYPTELQRLIKISFVTARYRGYNSNFEYR